MKRSIVFLVIGILLLFITIPYSLLSIISGINQLEQGEVSGGISGYLLIIGVVLGFVLTVIGATNIYLKK
jgi:ABC-type polysaccharide/polyol phosphate transport system ATPase subunit